MILTATPITVISSILACISYFLQVVYHTIYKYIYITLNVHLHFYDIFLSKFKPEFILG